MKTLTRRLSAGLAAGVVAATAGAAGLLPAAAQEYTSFTLTHEEHGQTDGKSAVVIDVGESIDLDLVFHNRDGVDLEISDVTLQVRNLSTGEIVDESEIDTSDVGPVAVGEDVTVEFEVSAAERGMHEVMALAGWRRAGTNGYYIDRTMSWYWTDPVTADGSNREPGLVIAHDTHGQTSAEAPAVVPVGEDLHVDYTLTNATDELYGYHRTTAVITRDGEQIVDEVLYEYDWLNRPVPIGLGPGQTFSWPYGPLPTDEPGEYTLRVEFGPDTMCDPGGGDAPEPEPEPEPILPRSVRPAGAVVLQDAVDYCYPAAEWHWVVSQPTPAVSIEKLGLDEDADTPEEAVQVEAGTEVTWVYEVTNTGETDLTDLVVTDDQGVEVTFPEDFSGTLAPGETVTATGTGVVAEGDYVNIGTVTAQGPDGDEVTDEDPWHGAGLVPAVSIEKLGLDEDADTPEEAVQVEAGTEVTWDYEVTNTGETDLTDLVVTDDQGVEVTFPEDFSGTLAPGETVTATGTGVVAEGDYVNVGTVTARTPGGTEVTDDDPWHGFGAAPQWTVDKTSDPADGELIGVGSDVTYTLTAQNTGDVDLDDLVVTDDLSGVLEHASLSTDMPEGLTVSGGTITWDIGELAAGETVTVSYVVTLHDDAYDVEIVNAAWGEGPVPPERCTSDAPCSTTHTTPPWPSSPELPQLGGTSAVTLVALGSLVVLAGAGALVVASRRAQQG